MDICSHDPPHSRPSEIKRPPSIPAPLHNQHPFQLLLHLPLHPHSNLVHILLLRANSVADSISRPIGPARQPSRPFAVIKMLLRQCLLFLMYLLMWRFCWRRLKLCWNCIWEGMRRLGWRLLLLLVLFEFDFFFYRIMCVCSTVRTSTYYWFAITAPRLNASSPFFLPKLCEKTTNSSRSTAAAVAQMVVVPIEYLSKSLEPIKR